MSDLSRTDVVEDRITAASASFRGQVITLLGDGKSRDAQTILEDGRERGFFSPASSKMSVYENLLLYIQQEIGAGRKPAIVQEPVSKKFRINHPVDDWPEVTLPSRPRYIDAVTLDALSTRLRTTATGDDSTAFEQAVCDAFATFGFLTQHIGGFRAPDGILDAPLGPLAYRAILECKSTPKTKFVSQPRPEEIVKFRAASNADFAVLVGPLFHATTDFTQELEAHAVAAWTVEDVITALRNDVDAYECRALFAPGFVHERLSDLEWNRSHGDEKRAVVVRQILRREGFAAQSAIVAHVTPSDAPVLTLDAAMILVETALRRAGVREAATREEVRAAMDDLTRSAEAVRIPERDGIVIRRGR